MCYGSLVIFIRLEPKKKNVSKKRSDCGCRAKKHISEKRIYYLAGLSENSNTQYPLLLVSGWTLKRHHSIAKKKFGNSLVVTMLTWKGVFWSDLHNERRSDINPPLRKDFHKETHFVDCDSRAQGTACRERQPKWSLLAHQDQLGKMPVGTSYIFNTSCLQYAGTLSPRNGYDLLPKKSGCVFPTWDILPVAMLVSYRKWWVENFLWKEATGGYLK